MIRLLATILIALIAFQASWAVSARYCEHADDGIAAAHFGHHSHIPMGESGERGDKPGIHADCLACHLVSSQAVFNEFPAVVSADVIVAPRLEPPKFPISGPIARPERPQWASLAQF